jgi:WD40 repeat protein
MPAAFHPTDNNSLLLINSEGVFIVNIWSGIHENVLNRVTNNVTSGLWTKRSYALSSDGKLLALGYGLRVRIWDLHSQQLLTTLEEHGRQFRTMIFTKDGKHLVTSHHDKAISVWNITACYSIDERPLPPLLHRCMELTGFNVRILLTNHNNCRPLSRNGRSISG